MSLDAKRNVRPLKLGADTQGVSDIYFDGGNVWLTYFYDASFSALPAKRFSVVQ
jgi:hypothetical protein